MRIRALLFIPALAAAALAVGVSSASAATIFSTNNHAGSRVAINTVTTATSEGPLNFTRPTGTVSNTCSHISLTTRVVENTDARSTLEVFGSHFGTCDPLPFSGTHTPTWRLTILGTAPPYTGTVDNVQLELAGAGLFTGNLENGITVSQSAATNNICVNFADSGTVTNHALGLAFFLDGRLCLTSAPGNAWSLT